jgi:acetylornithine deacetylase
MKTMASPQDAASMPAILDAEPLTKTLQALVRINSVNPNYDGPKGGEALVIDWAEAFLKTHGLTPEQWEAAAGRPNLSLVIPGRDPSRTMLFETHVDTVSISGMSIEPLAAEVRDGRMWSRGTTDAKGQVAAMLHATVAAAQGDQPPRVNVQLVLVVDEEYGFIGVKSLVQRYQDKGTMPVAAVVGEPTGLLAVVAHKGSQRWWIEFEGRSAHSAKPHLGVNAIAHAAALVQKLETDYARELKQRRHPLVGCPTINVSIISGGTAGNLVPGSARILLDRRVLPGESRRQILDEFETIIRNLKEQIPELKVRQLDPILDDPPLESDVDHPFVKTACALSGRFGRSAEPGGVDYATDGSKLAQVGIPTIVVGPGSIDQAHTEDEWIELDELQAGAQYYYELMRAGPGS